MTKQKTKQKNTLISTQNRGVLDFPDDTRSMSYQPRRIISQAVKDVFFPEKIEFQLIRVEHPNNENYGDYATNIAMILAGRAKRSPVELAKQVSERINNYIIQHQSITWQAESNNSEVEKIKVSDTLEKTEVGGVGFVNLWLQKEYLISQMGRVLVEENAVNITQIGKDKKVMIEFAHPNTHKEFHIGHLRNISIGESLVRILEECGVTLFRANYEGDVGLHVAKAIWGVTKKLRTKNLELRTLEKLSPQEKAKFLGEAYALGSKAYEGDKKAQAEIMSINKQIYQNPHKVDLWEETRGWSLEYFDTVYKRLGSHFDRYFFESEVEAQGRKLVTGGVKKGIFVKDSDGSIYFPGSKYGLNDCVFVTREGYATYEGKDIAVEELEYQTFPFDLDIHVVANEQKNFFEIAFKALEILFPHQKGRQYHLAYGMVNLKGGKLSSRTGEVVTADELIDSAKEKIREIIRKAARGKRDELKTGEIEEVAEKVAVAAVKYSMLRVNPRMDIAFDLEKSVSFEGDSGPYLQYTYARCKSVMRKAQVVSRITYQVLSMKKDQKYNIRNTKYVIPNTEELFLLRAFYRFPEVVTEAARTLSPNLVCSYLFDLAQKFNLFYQKHSILGKAKNLKLRTKNQELRTESDKDTSDGGEATTSTPPRWRNQAIISFRLSMTQATAAILKQGLKLLGIETVERM